MQRLLIVAVMLALACGCIRTEPMHLPDASRADSSAVRAGVVYVGMEADLARKALGPPQSVDSRRGREQWQYEFRVLCSRNMRQCTQRATLYIEDGAVTGYNNFPGYRTLPQP